MSVDDGFPAGRPGHELSQTALTPGALGLRKIGAVVGLLMVVVMGLAMAPCAVAAGSARERETARAINLRAADLPGFSQQRSRNNAPGNALDGRLTAKCPGLMGSTTPHPGSVDVSSPVFVESSSGVGELSAQSRVSIERSRRTVASDLALAQNRRVRACLKGALEGFTTTEQGIQVTITGVRVSRLPVNAAGVGGAFGIRVQGSISSLILSLPFRLDIIGFGVGREEIGLFTGGVGESFPPTTEQRLSSLLLSRALANSH